MEERTAEEIYNKYCQNYSGFANVEIFKRRVIAAMEEFADLKVKEHIKQQYEKE